MRRIVVLGEPSRVRGFRLAGVTVVEATGVAEVTRMWEALPADAVLVILTADAAEAIQTRLAERPRLIRAVMP